jgi:hypothetical protein
MAMLPSTNCMYIFDDVRAEESDTDCKLVDNGTGSTVTGSIMISSSAGGSGVSVSVNFTGFPSESEYGPFVYHIHEFPVSGQYVTGYKVNSNFYLREK